jgi:hypothetical protein
MKTGKRGALTATEVPAGSRTSASGLVLPTQQEGESTRTSGRMAKRVGLAVAMVCTAWAPVVLVSPAQGAMPATSPIASSHARTVHVRGTLTPVDVAQGTYDVHGDLVGRWTTPTFVPIYESVALNVAKGTEGFKGCLDRRRHNGQCGSRERSGDLRFEFIQWTTANPRTGAFIEGRCVHAITGGTGDFAGARGLLTMRDLPVGNVVRTTYQGDVVLNAVPSETSVAALDAGASSANARPATARSC